MTKFQLDVTGTVDEKRMRLVAFVRKGKVNLTSPIRPNLPPLTIPVIVQTVPSPSGPSDVWNAHKWQVYFDGKGDPATFIERIEEFCTSRRVNLNEILPVLPELLKGEAASWFRNNKRLWDEFLNAFREVYLPLDYLENLEADIARRLQRKDGSTLHYVTDLQTLIRRHGKLTAEQEQRWWKSASGI